MTTSGTYSFTVNRDQIIRQAMLNIGALDSFEDPTPDEVSDFSMVLNMLVKQYQAKGDFAAGLKIWTRRRGHLFLSGTTGQYLAGPGATGWAPDGGFVLTTTSSASSSAAIIVNSATGIAATYNIGVQLDSGTIFWTTVLSVVGATVTLNASLPSQSSAGSYVYCYQTAATQPIVIETALLRDNQSTDTPLRIIRDVREYDALPNKADPDNIGDPIAIYPEFQLGNSNIFTDVAAAQDVTKHIVITYMESIQDFNNPTDNPEYPQEYYLFLCWSLSKQIAPGLRRTWTPLMQSNHDAAMLIAQKKEPEISSMYFQCGED